MRVCQVSMLDFKSSWNGASPVNTFSHTTFSIGATSKLMKPSCEFASSIYGEGKAKAARQRSHAIAFAVFAWTAKEYRDPLCNQ